MKKAMISAALMMTAALTSPAMAQQKLSDVEQKVVTYVDHNFDQQMAFLEEQVNINSDTMNFAGVRASGDMYMAGLRDMGFDVSWFNLPKSANRAGHLMARRKGTKGKRILLLSHLDTVHAKDGSFQTFKRAGDRATGPGVEDDKNGGVVIYYAMKALHSIGALDGADIHIMMTGDEELPSEDVADSRAPMVAAAKEADVVLSFEPGEEGVGVVARRGYSGWILSVKGNASHSSRVFTDKVGAGASYEMARIIHDFYTKVREPNVTFQAGAMMTGTNAKFDYETSRGTLFGKQNVVAQEGSASGDIRAISVEQLKRIEDKMTAIVADNLPGTSATIKFNDDYKPMASKPGNVELMHMVSDINVALGGKSYVANDPMTRGAGDISFVAFMMDYALDGMGGGGGGAHTVDEWMSIPDFKAATKRAALTIYRLIHSAK